MVSLRNESLACVYGFFQLQAHTYQSPIISNFHPMSYFSACWAYPHINTEGFGGGGGGAAKAIGCIGSNKNLNNFWAHFRNEAKEN